MPATAETHERRQGGVPDSWLRSLVGDERNHFWYIGRRAIFFDLLRHEVGEQGPDALIFDLGCGVGGMLEGLGELGTAFGTDLYHEMLEICRQRGLERVFEASSHQLPLPDASARILTAFDVLEHIPQETDVLAECFRVLEPGGFLFLSGPAYQWLYTHQDRLVDHQRRYTIRELRRKLEASGFELVRGSYIQFFLFPPILVLTLLRKLREWWRPPSGTVALNVEIQLPGPLNGLFGAIFSAERFLLRHFDLPFGHSVIALARKPR